MEPRGSILLWRSVHNIIISWCQVQGGVESHVDVFNGIVTKWRIKCHQLIELNFRGWKIWMKHRHGGRFRHVDVASCIHPLTKKVIIHWKLIFLLLLVAVLYDMEVSRIAVLVLLNITIIEWHKLRYHFLPIINSWSIKPTCLVHWLLKCGCRWLSNG